MLALPIDWTHYSCLLFTVPVWGLVRYILTRSIRGLTLRTQWASKRQPMATKLAESTFYLTQYIFLYAFSRALIKQRNIQPYNFEEFFSDYPLRKSFSPILNKFFLTQLTVYIVSFLFLFIETRKDNTDFMLMVVHHVVACALIVAGYSFRHYNFGIVLANLHDVSDIFLESSKLINMTIGEPWSLVTFIIFTLTFFVARIIVYPTYLILPPIMGVCDRLVEGRLGPGTSCGETTLHRWGFYTVLLSLYIIDCYWMAMITKMVFRIFKLEVRGDIRDDVENASKQ